MCEPLFRTGYIGLGSNMGDPGAYLRRALDALNGAEHTEVEDVSPVFRTEPQGLRGQAWFSNCVARIRTALGPEALLATLAGIEARLGRVRELKWGPRTIDLDILLLGDIRWSSDTLEIPHPRMCGQESRRVDARSPSQIFHFKTRIICNGYFSGNLHYLICLLE